MRTSVAEVDVLEALRCLQTGTLLIDLRESHETALGAPEHALSVPASLWSDPQQIARFPDGGMLICASGKRSEALAARLDPSASGRWRSVSGGCQAWRKAGLPWQRAADFSASEYQRYARQLILPGFGLDGQRRLKAAKLLLVGAGGLGSPSLLYLAAAGVGRLTVVDGDRVELSNLHRQVAHNSLSLGEWKARSAAMMGTALNPEVEIVAETHALTRDNADALISAHDLVLDGSDNFATRYLVNDVCVRLGRPLVYAAVHRFEGQVSVFAPHLSGPCYRCLHPVPPSALEAPNCAEAGVLGVVPGVMGLLQANEAIKFLAGIGQSLVGRLLCMDLASMRIRTLELRRDPDCPGCGPQRNGSNDLLESDVCAFDVQGP